MGKKTISNKNTGQRKVAAQNKGTGQKQKPHPKLPTPRAGESHSHFSHLRQQAEGQLQGETVAPGELSPLEATRLIHELQVHQVELEIQNEELKRSQIELAESLEGYADLYDFAPVGYLGLDKKGRITDANLTAAALLQSDRQRLLGHYFWMFLVKADYLAFARIMKNVPNLSERSGEFHLQMGKGKVRNIWVNLRFSWDLQRPEFCRLTLTDISELKQAQLRLEESQAQLTAERQRLDALLEALPAAVCVKGPDLSLKYANRVFEEAFQEKNWQGQPCYRVIMGSTKPCKCCPTLRVFGAGAANESEFTGRNNRTYLINDHLFKDVDGSSQVLTLLLDITERKRTEEALRESREDLRYLANQLFDAQERERQRIAMDLHDDLGQSLVALKLYLRTIAMEVPPHLATLKDQITQQAGTVDGILDTVRRLSQDLRPTILEDLGLTAALQRLLQDFAQQHGLELSLRLEDVSALLPPEAQSNIFRVFQESLTNIAKYARATRVAVTVERKPGRVAFAIQDDGEGFDADRVLTGGATRRSLGLTAMKERVRMLGGTLSITSRKGTGTKILFSVPIPSAEP